MEKGISGIYKITNPKGRVYIGQSKCIKSRWDRYKGMYPLKQPRLKESLTKYGQENHIFEVIEECLPEDLNKRERYWQEFYDVLDRLKGLNCVLTETDVEIKIISEQTKEKMRKAKEGMFLGENNPFFGKTHTEETRDKIRQANIEYLKFNPHPSLGRKASEEERRNSSERMKGKYVGSKNPMYGVPSPMTGKYHTEESKRKISEKAQGRGLGLKMSEEARANMSKAQSGEGNARAKRCINIETGIFYGCIKDAAIAYGIPKGTLQGGLNKSKKYKQFLLL